MSFSNFSSVTELLKEQRKRDERLHKLFDEIDMGHNGTIEFEELYNTILKFDKTISRSELQKSWNVVDMDSSNSIDFNEFKRLMTAHFENSGDATAKLQRLLSNHECILNEKSNTNTSLPLSLSPANSNSPKLTTSKVIIPINSHYLKQQKKRNEELDKKFKKIFEIIDIDNNGAISFNELWVVVQLLNSNIKREELQKQFDFVDIDNSHSIDFTQFKKLMTIKMNDGSSNDDLTTRLQKAFTEEKLFDIISPQFKNLGKVNNSINISNNHKKNKNNNNNENDNIYNINNGYREEKNINIINKKLEDYYARLTRKQIENWNNEEAINWICYIFGNNNYNHIIKSNNINGKLLFQLSRTQLSDIGITNKHDQNKILLERRRIKLRDRRQD